MWCVVCGALSRVIEVYQNREAALLVGDVGGMRRIGGGFAGAGEHWHSPHPYARPGEDRGVLWGVWGWCFGWRG